ncbi:hypothetical protein AcW1_008256 [Taiwanofungus camphoratus]|nr:hypothetical protein AcV5_008553 [Antrodia cinnamomea]KAI0951143.1 hypothetical protein AcW1_008256 [Antrodia cinnamomea]KAI0956030.1 hypothetical protein AcV7_006541 [Antrodia cinnamomea]
MSNEGTVALNNYLQSQNQLSLLSWEESTTGPQHAPEWTSICKIGGQVVGTGRGAQRHIARDMAAKEALKALTSQADG